ncbi:MAG: hypothetical protein AB8H12_15450 [Lewinella sp.]
MNNKFIGLLLSLVLLTACEQERREDTQFLHPYSGDMPVVFAYLHNGTARIDVQAMRTLPYYSPEPEANLIDLSGSLNVSGQSLSDLVPVSAGRYTIDLDEVLTIEPSYHLALEHPDFGAFRTAAVSIPSPVEITDIDTTRQQERISLSGGVGSVPTGLSVSSKLLRYGEGIILNSEGGELLPIRDAEEFVTDVTNRTRTYAITERFVIFDPDTRVPVDTIMVDSVQLILYTWGEEVIRFNRSRAGTNQEFGDGDETIDGTSWSNVEGGHGLVAGFATDTVTVVLR